MKIRPYSAGDRSAVFHVWEQCQLVVPQNDPAKDILRKLQVNPEWFLVAEADGKIVATCMVGYEGHRGWINYLAVLPERQRQGIATGLMRRAEELLREAGCPKINLQVREANSAVVDFYRSLGFSVDPVLSLGKRLVVDAGKGAS